MKHTSFILPVILSTFVAAAGCSSSKSDGGSSAPAPTTAAEPAPTPSTAPTPAPAASGDPATTADEIYAQRCVTCHGADGRGDGIAAKGLTPPPRNFADPKWQESITDEDIEKIIQLGGPAVGKAPSMPPNPDLSDVKVLQALRAKVRGFAAK